MRYLLSFFLVGMFVGGSKESTSPQTIAIDTALEIEVAQSHSLYSGTLPRLQPLITIMHRRRVDSVLFSPNGKILASESFGDGVKLSDTRSGRLVHTLALRGYSANSIGFSHDGSILAIGTNRGDVDLWDMQTLRLQKTVDVTKWSIYAVALSPNGSILASCGADGTVQVWDLHEVKLKLTLGSKGERMSSLAFSPEGTLLAALSRYGKCCVWKTRTGELVGKIARAGDGELGQVSFCPDTNTVAIMTPFKLIFWGPLDNKKSRIVSLPESIDPMRKKLPPGGGPIMCPRNTLSRDCKTVATGLEDGTIAVWDVKTKAIKCFLIGDHTPNLMGGGIETIAFSPDNHLLGSGNRNGKVQIWRINGDHKELSAPTALDNNNPDTNQKKGQPNKELRGN